MLFNFIMGKLSEEHYPKADVKKCISFYNMSKGCGKCRDACPKKAITFGVEKIKFDENLCNNCGICMAVCPTKTINIKDFGEGNLMRLIEEKDENKEKIIISCSSMSGLGNIKVKCLNGIHGELLAALFIVLNDRKIYFNLSKCQDCTMVEDGYKQFLQTLKDVEIFLNAAGFIPKYEIIKNEEGISLPEKEPISRREVFSLLKKESTNVATQTANKFISNSQEKIDIRNLLIKAIEENRNLFNEDFLEDVDSTKIPFFKFWDVTDKCNGCRVCQNFCPEGAWKVEKNGEDIKISHNSGKCTRCNICVNLCSKKAIIPGKFSIDSLLGYEQKDFKKT